MHVHNSLSPQWTRVEFGNCGVVQLLSVIVLITASSQAEKSLHRVLHNEILEAAKYDTCNEVKAEFGFKTNFLTLVFRIVQPCSQAFSASHLLYHLLKCFQRSLISKY